MAGSNIAERRRQKQLDQLLKRRHPEYSEMLPHWNFLEATYNGGREWFQANIFRYVKEGDKEFKDRLDRCYRFNHTRETVDLVQKYIFKTPVVRNEDDAPEQVRAFWKSATRSELDINQYAARLSTLSAIYGRVWVVVDSSKPEGALTRADEIAAGARVYSYAVKPQDALDFAFDDEGRLLWILIREIARDDADPLNSSGAVYERFRLWTRESWHLYRIEEDNKKTIVVEVDSGTHPLGVVPVFPLDHVVGEHKYSAPGLINDIAYLDRAVANYLSNLDAIIQDQTFSQLAMPAQNVLPGEEQYNQLVEMGTKRIFLYDGEGGAAPEYLSPDPRQAGMIVEVVNKIINEIYHTIGMAGERTKQDNAVGTDNSSGVAKAYDFERVNSLLAAKADSLENAENKLVELVMRWNGGTAPAEELVKYADNFDVRSLYDEFTIANQLMLIAAPDEVRRHQMDLMIEKLFPRLPQDLLKKMRAELGSWPPAPEAPSTPPSSFSSANRNTQTSNRQGEVTANTPAT